MKLQPTTDSLARAAETALAQIRSDRDRADYPLKRLFEHLEENLFLPELTVDALLAAARTRGSKTFQRFQDLTGLSPRAYLEERRLETAVGLLLAEEIPLAAVAEQVGYSSLQAFGRAFRRWAGVAPGQFRRNLRAVCARGVHPPRATWFTSEWLRRFDAGDLELAERKEVIEWLRGAYELGPAGPADGRGGEQLLAYERRWAEEWWRLALELPAAQLREHVETGPFETPVFFEHLCQKSREEGQTDPRRGVELAELALVALERLHAWLSEDALEQLRARGRACLAEARRLAGEDS